jgi:Protein of unknown function (DUF3126)
MGKTGMRSKGLTAMDALEITRLQEYLRSKFAVSDLSVRARSNKDDSAEVYLGDEFIGVIFRDDEDGDVSYDFNMAILEIDLPERPAG